MNWLFSLAGGGHSVFDQYSLVHIVWFIALTTIFIPIFKKKTWLAMAGLGIVWETLELWIYNNIPWLPYVGSEDFCNKWIGDIFCDVVGFLIAWYCIKKSKDV